ncbi:amino acid ABC transporter permease [Rhodovarius lipocyclicus]|uniref:amino acid ABC transporter permease n=1 Tax=Rhodovarius lipocyclicus TaxID=268410 RepID=UPI00191750E5|nr:amino acid ABC transporter permease [Rhodovarius lipocyclicus]
MSFPALLGWMPQGLGVTLLVALYAAVIAFPFALVFGVLEFKLRGPAKLLVTLFIDFWRSSSVIILLFLFYYVGPAFEVFLSAYTVGAVVIGCNIGAYGSQALRSALESVGKGQVEAGLSLGLRPSRILLLIQLPQALRKVVPIAGNEAIEIIKTTANISLIGLADITYRAKEAMQATFQPAQIYTGLLLIYVLISLPFALGLHWLARRTRVRER